MIKELSLAMLALTILNGVVWAQTPTPPAAKTTVEVSVPVNRPFVWKLELPASRSVRNDFTLEVNRAYPGTLKNDPVMVQQFDQGRIQDLLPRILEWGQLEATHEFSLKLGPLPFVIAKEARGTKRVTGHSAVWNNKAPVFIFWESLPQFIFGGKPTSERMQTMGGGGLRRKPGFTLFGALRF